MINGVNPRGYSVLTARVLVNVYATYNGVLGGGVCALINVDMARFYAGVNVKYFSAKSVFYAVVCA